MFESLVDENSSSLSTIFAVKETSELAPLVWQGKDGFKEVVEAKVGKSTKNSSVGP